MALFSKGIMLTQYKEPALSSRLVHYTNPQPSYFTLKGDISFDPTQLSPQDILSIAKAARIYDERDGRLLVSKLRRVEGKATGILVDAIDDEPYLSSKVTPMLQLRKELLIGLELCRRVVGTENVSIQTYRHMGELHSNIPSKIGGVRVEKLSGGYPALPSGTGLGRKAGGEQLIVGVGALIHLARGATGRVPQTTTFVTVAGNCIANPMNLEVSLGMNLTEVIERCGLRQKPTRIIAGGPMTGVAVINTDTTLITPTTRGILAVKGETNERSYQCVGCGRCEENCPVGLNPMYINSFMTRKYYPQLSMFDADHCIGCGTCSYVCPSRLNLVGTMAKARAYALTHLVPKEEDTDQEEDDLEV